MRIVLLYNPAAAGGSAPPLAELRSELSAVSTEIEAIPVSGDRTRALLRHALERPCHRLVCAGGDGTAHLAANVLAHRQVPLVALPCGTANDFARSLGMPRRWRDALRVGLASPARAVDLGVVNGEYFLNALSVGMGAQRTARLPTWLKRALRGLAYPIGLAAPGPRRQAWPFIVEVAGECHRLEAHQVLVANGPRFGGGFRVSPEARLDEGLLDVVVVERGWPALVHGLLRPGAPWMTRLGNRRWRVQHLRLQGPACGLVAVDGEVLIVEPPLEVSLAPGALWVGAPSGPT